MRVAVAVDTPATLPPTSIRLRLTLDVMVGVSLVPVITKLTVSEAVSD